MPEVELSITCWERTYERVLSPGFFPAIEKANRYRFAKRIVVINNVNDRREAVTRAERLVADGEIDGYRLVEKELDAALRRTGISLRHLRPLEYYTNHFLVAVAAEGPRFLVCWDADAKLDAPVNWVGPCVDLMSHRPDILVGQPGWRDRWSMDGERLDTAGDFDLGYGFTDHVFLVDRARLAGPVYRRVAPAS